MFENKGEIVEIVKNYEEIAVGVCYNRRGKKYYTVINLKGKEENHTHFNNYNIACMVAGCVNNKKIPYRRSLLSHCLRLSTDKDYTERLRNNKVKEKYVNINKGAR